MDMPGCQRLRREAGARWSAFATGEARLPIGEAILGRVRVGLRIPLVQEDAVVRVSIPEPAKGGEERMHELRSNEDGLFDVTGLGLI